MGRNPSANFDSKVEVRGGGAYTSCLLVNLMRREIMRHLLLTLFVGVLSTSLCHAGPRNPYRLQLNFEVDAFTPDFLEVLKKRAASYADFRGYGPAKVMQPKPGAPTVVVEFPVKRWEARKSEALVDELKYLLTRTGGLEFTWDRGRDSLEALQKLQKALGVGWVDEHDSPHLRLDSTLRYEEIEAAVAKEAPGPGLRWVIERLIPKKRKMGPEYVVYAAAAPGFLTDNGVQSVTISKTIIGWEGLLVTFTPEAAKVFAKETEAHVKDRLLIMFEGQIVSSPIVYDGIRSGRALIDLGRMSSRGMHKGEVRRLMATMNSGKLDVPVRFVSAQALDPLPVEKDTPAENAK